MCPLDTQPGERAVLNRELVADAERILANNSLPCDRIVAVDRDSILYVNRQLKARTCWLDLPEHGRMRVQMVPGFAADPPFGWHAPPRPPNYGLTGAV